MLVNFINSYYNYFMTGLVLKLSYNNMGDEDLEGGICGSFFFINKKTIVTAHHVLSKENFKPNNGFSKCQYWFLIEPDLVIEVNKDDLIEFPGIDTTLIQLKKSVEVPIRRISKAEIQIGQTCFNEGFVGGLMPGLNAQWGTDRLIISGCQYANTRTLGDGFVHFIRMADINMTDIKMSNVNVLQTSYGGIQGMSGGALIDKDSNEIIGLMSFGLPPDLQVKQALFAVPIQKVIDKLPKRKIRPKK